MSECSHNCSDCAENCSERTEIQKEKPHKLSRIKKVIAVVSGKGGVGKSLVTGLLAVNAARRGCKTAILDADVTGPSVPKAFGLKEKAKGGPEGLYPVVSAGGVRVMSLNLLLDNETDPVVWRGPIIAGAVKQFWTDVIWDDVDYMFVDMPPGTGDVPLTVFQSLPVDGIVIVTTPQELVSMIVEKAVNMAALMHVPVIGLVENMSYFVCPDCGKTHFIFGKSNVEALALRHGITGVARLPIDPTFAAKCDAGEIEQADNSALDTIAAGIEAL